MLSQKLLPVVKSAPEIAKFNNTTLLLTGDGTSGAKNATVLDSSSNNFTVTRAGNTPQGNFSPFSLPEGHWSVYFDGTGDNLYTASSTNLTPYSADFTIECWVYTTTSGVEQQIYYNSGVSGIRFYLDASRLPVLATNTGVLMTSSIAVELNTWTHVALVRIGTTAKIYINGVSTSSVTDSTSFARTIFYVGSGLIGFISNLRFVNGTGVYTSNFTPPTTPLTAVANTQLLICQSNTFKDNSSNNFAFTSRNGDARVASFSPFVQSATYNPSVNGGSIYYDGSGDYMLAPNNSAFNLAGDATVECWFYAPNSTGGMNICCKRWYSAEGYVLNSTGIRGVINGTWSDSQLGWTVQGFCWNHIAFVKSGTNLTVYVNGVQAAQKTGVTSINAYDTEFALGIQTRNGEAPATGYISNFRFTTGVAVYSSNFTPPTAPLPAISGTSLLLNLTNAGVYDATMKNNIETVGDTQINTTTKKYGTGSIYFDGTGDYLVVTHKPEHLFYSGKFTIECWVQLAAVGSVRGIVGKGTGTTGWLISTNASNQVVFTYGSNTITSTATLSISTWYHIAVSRSGTGSNLTKIFINGVNDGTGTVATNFTEANNIVVGADRTGTNPLNGYIDDLRVVNGQALYTSNFAPPTALPVQ